jgi:hypothetical protein
VEEVYRRLEEGHFFGGSTLVGLFMAERHLRGRGWLGGAESPPTSSGGGTDSRRRPMTRPLVPRDSLKRDS